MRTLHALTAWMALFWLGLSGAADAASVTQTITLRPGWNAVHIEIDPEDPTIDTVLAGIPIRSVWRYAPEGGGPQYIADPSEGLESIEGWFGWFPEPRPEAFLSNLYQITGNAAYLIRVDGSATHTLTLTGKPRYRAPRWQPNGFTLTGLPVVAENAPSFAEFFAPSPAHSGQPVYRLNASGQWELLTNLAATPIQRGEAYWIYTDGNTKFQGTTQLILEQGEEIDFTAALDETRLVLRNRSGLAGSFLIERVGGGDIPIRFKNEDPETGEVGWPYLQQQLVLDAPADQDVFLTLAIERTEFTADRMEDILAISDEHGERVQIAIGGNSKQPTGAVLLGKSKRATVVNGLAGLWVGDVEVTAVSEAQTAGTVPTPVNRPFKQRFLMHVDAGGNALLLKDVIQMWEDGTTAPSASVPGYTETVEPGRYVLLTDKDLIGLYSGASNVDGTGVGIRYSTVAYDFDGQTLPFTGSFAVGSEVTVAIVVPPDLTTNPFRHKFHPDHDNLDENFLNERVEAYQVVRNVEFQFTEQDPSGAEIPGWGDSVMGGAFSESITGLHKNAIFTSGVFHLRRVSAVPLLNQ